MCGTDPSPGHYLLSAICCLPSPSPLRWTLARPLRRVLGIWTTRLIFVSLWVASVAVAQSTAPSDRAIHEAVLQLGAPSAADRERAMQWLASAGELARAELEQAARSSDPEMRSRARQLLGDLQLGMTVDTPRETRELVRSYRSGDAAQKRSALQAMLQQGPAAMPLMARLAVIETDPAVRQQLIDLIGRDAGHAASVFIAAGQLKEAREILESAAQGGAKPHVQALAALLVLTDTADARIAELRKLAAVAMPRHQAALLGYLLRARGNLPAARDVAAEAHDDELRQDVLLDMGDFKSLAVLLAGARRRASQGTCCRWRWASSSAATAMASRRPLPPC